MAIKILATLSAEVALIQVTKPYKPRKLKQDPASRLRRQAYKYSSKNPNWQRKRKIYRKKFLQKNKHLLKRRHEFVRKTRKAMGLK